MYILTSSFAWDPMAGFWNRSFSGFQNFLWAYKVDFSVSSIVPPKISLLSIIFQALVANAVLRLVLKIRVKNLNCVSCFNLYTLGVVQTQGKLCLASAFWKWGVRWAPKLKFQWRHKDIVKGAGTKFWRPHYWILWFEFYCYHIDFIIYFKWYNYIKKVRFFLMRKKQK